MPLGKLVKTEFFAYIISQKQRATQQKKFRATFLGENEAHMPIFSYFWAVSNLAKVSRGRPCLQHFNLPQEKKINMLLTGIGSVCTVKNCDLRLVNAALSVCLAAFSRPWWQFFTKQTSQPASNIMHTFVCILQKQANSNLYEMEKKPLIFFSFF